MVQEEILFKIFLIWSSGGPPFQWSRTIYAILEESIMGNIHVKLLQIWTSGSGSGGDFTDDVRTMDRLITIAHLEPLA